MARRKRPSKKRGLKTKLGGGSALPKADVELYSKEQENSRALALGSLNLLDTPPEERFDRLCRLAQNVVGAPATYISLIDRERQWFKSTCGMPDISETPREGTFCDYAIQRSRPTVVLDADADPLFCQSPYVTDGPKVKFYAGFPLMVQGQRVGTLCALDFEARDEVSDEEMDQLYDLARIAEKELTFQEESKLLYTTLSSKILGFERLLANHYPEVASSVVNQYRETMEPIAARWQGQVDGFSGGSFRVLFPMKDDSQIHILAAAACSLEMQLAIAELNEVLHHQGQPTLFCGIGVHSCESSQQADHIRDLASEGQVLVSEAVVQALGRQARVSGHLRLRIPGFEQSVNLFELVGLASEPEGEPS